MLIHHKRGFTIGLILTGTFLVVLFMMFSPIFKGANAFMAADDLFNTISKGSSYYIPKLVKSCEKYKGKTVELTLKFGDEGMANKAKALFTKAGANAEGAGPEVKMTGDLGQVLAAALSDSDVMFQNRGEEIAQKYGFPEKEVLLAWWTLFKEMEKGFKAKKEFAEAAVGITVNKKAVEPSYNFYKIKAEKVSSKAGILLFSLVFYVIYTMWWGYAILYLFDGFGLKMKAGKKKEV